MLVDIHRLKIFLKIADLKSFTIAAESCYLTQPTVSQHVATLEQFFGLPLFNRSGKELSLTEAGELLYRHATQVSMQFDELLQSLELYKGKRAGQLIIGASSIPGECILPKVLGAFRRVYPEVTIKLRITDTQTTVQMVLDRTVDIAVVGSELKNPQLTYAPIIEDELILIVPKGHKWWDTPSVTLQELAGEPFVMRKCGSGTRIEMGRTLQAAGFDPQGIKVAAEVDTNVAIKESVAAGLGISFVSKCCVGPDLQNNRFKAVSVCDLTFSRCFYSVCEKNRVPSPLCISFKQFLENHCKSSH